MKVGEKKHSMCVSCSLDFSYNITVQYNGYHNPKIEKISFIFALAYHQKLVSRGDSSSHVQICALLLTSKKEN
jgi:hypothetical protein